jgi:hypothetical protein
MNIGSLLRRSLALATCAALLANVAAARASIVAPYTLDANTIFLLHLDEPATEGIATNAVEGAASFIASANPSAATPRNPLPGLLGATGASGPGYNFGLCADLTFSNSVGLFMDANANGVADLDVSGAAPGADAISGSVFTGPNGEFTLEALVNFPSLTGGNREIISMDNSGGAGARPFQFRVTSAGLLEFNNIAVAGANPRAAIPTTGPDAFVPNQWFHVAMTYDGAGNIVFYWTRLDGARTGATVLLTTNVALLNISGTAVLTIGNENRNTCGEGLTGLIDEVRISNIARGPTEMVFDPSAPPIPPSINPQPEDQFLGVGETLVIVSHASGSLPLAYRWQYEGFAGGGFSDIPEQTGETLSIPVTFATRGYYRYIVSNAFGQATSAVATVTVGATFSGLAPTGFDLNGAPLPDNAIDPHYTLWSSSDPNLLGPNTVVPANTLDYNANDAGSKWISPGPTLAGVRGVYSYRTTFVLDSTVPQGSTLTASVLSGGSLTVLLNGQPTGISNLNPAFPGPHRIAFTFTLTNGFVGGVNTLDFVVDNSTTAPNSPPGNALRVMSIRGIGPALGVGLAIVQHPQSQTVRVGGRVTFDVIARGRPPLHYQWFGDGVEIAGATNRTLTYDPVTVFDQPTTFRVIVTDDSVSQTSQSANLTVVNDNQPPAATNVALTGFSGAPLRLPLSRLVQNARDPDGDSIVLSTYDTVGSNLTSPGQITQDGATLIYTNAADFNGEDQFTVTLADTLGAPAVVTVTIQLSSDLRLRITRGPNGNVRLTWPAAATSQGFRLLSGDAIDAITAPAAGTIATDATESVLRIFPADPMKFYRLIYP